MNEEPKIIQLLSKAEGFERTLLSGSEKKLEQEGRLNFTVV
jgi:hypothetical protein